MDVHNALTVLPKPDVGVTDYTIFDTVGLQGSTVNNGDGVIDAGETIALGFTLAMVLFACIREKLALAKMPKWMDGFPGALITAGLMAVAFAGFGGLIK